MNDLNKKTKSELIKIIDESQQVNESLIKQIQAFREPKNICCIAVKFEKGTKILTEGKYHQCILSDEKTAIFARLKGNRRLCYKKLFAVCNIPSLEDGFNYDIVK